MQELTELRLDSGVLILDGTRVMSPVIPRSYRDVDNDILVKGTSVIEGAVYTRNLSIESGPFSVAGALFAKESLTSLRENSGAIRFRKAVACNGTISLEDEGRKTFGADVNAAVVRLRNAVVAASVFGAEIVLEDCIVLGGVFATKSLSAARCVMGTFNAPSASLSGDTYILHPSVFTVEPLHVAEGGRLVNLTLADLGNLFKGQPERDLTGAIEIDPVVDEQKVSLTDEKGNDTLWETYSVAGKVLAADLLDLEKLDNHFLLSAGSLDMQLVKRYDFGTDAEGKPITLSLDVIGDFLSDIQTGRKPVRRLSGTISFDDLKRFYADL